MKDDGAARVRPNPPHDLAAAVGFLTLLPVGRDWPAARRPRSVGYYPWVGWLLGGLAGGSLLAARALAGQYPRSAALLGGALVIAGWGLLTRLLHWDGLADTADGLWGGHDAQGRLEIMRDSRVGSFGAAAIALTALVQVGAAASVVSQGRWWVLVTAPVIARAGASAAAWTIKAARLEGLGLTTVSRPGAYDVAVWAVATAGVASLVLAGAPGAALATTCMAGLAAAILLPAGLSRPVGGVTGDILGASVILVETVVLVVGGVAR